MWGTLVIVSHPQSLGSVDILLQPNNQQGAQTHDPS